MLVLNLVLLLDGVRLKQLVQPALAAS